MNIGSLLDNPTSHTWSVLVKVGDGQFIVGPFPSKSMARMWVSEAKHRLKRSDDTKFLVHTSWAPKMVGNDTRKEALT